MGGRGGRVPTDRDDVIGAAVCLVGVGVIMFSSADQFAAPLDLQLGLKLYGDVVSTYTIGEAARRSGFSASALRFYEDIGLVDPTGRTESGYRLYDDESLARLAFIARAKQLGCSLEEITDLVDIWDGQRCGPVQRRFHELLTTKIQQAETKVSELSAFGAQLRASAEQLAGEPIDGPCGPDCACLTVDTADDRTVESAMVTLGRKPAACRWRSRSPAPWSWARCRTGSPSGPACCGRRPDGRRSRVVCTSSSVPTSTSLTSAG